MINTIRYLARGCYARPGSEGVAATGPKRITPEVAMGTELYFTPLV